MTRFVLHRLVPLIVLAMACAAGAADAKTLRYASQDDPQTFDPHSANLLATSRLTSQIYEALVFRDKDWIAIPWLALSWSQPNDRTWRFKLREGVTFHDGAPFTADDVVFSVERALSPLSQLKNALQGVESARKVDNFTVDMIMKEPNPVLPAHLFNFRIMNKAWAVRNRSVTPQNYKEKEDTFSARHANGTGPYLLKSHEPDIKTLLVKNPNWWGIRAGLKGNVDEVVILPIKSNATRIAALLSGEVDFVIDPPLQDVQRLRANPDLKVQEGPDARVQYLAFDMQRDELLYSSVKGRNPFKDLRVRQAVAHAIDADAIKAKVMRGLATPVGTLITERINGFSPEANKRIPYDREKARKLLAEAGYAKGFEVTLDCGNNQPAADICQAVAVMLTQIGIKTRPNIVPIANYFPKIEKYDTSFYLISWGAASTSDALYTLQSLLHSATGKNDGDLNLGRYSNPKMDALIQKVKVEGDMKKRNEYIRQALLLNNADLPTVAIHQPLVPWVMRKNIAAPFTPVNTVYFHQVNVQ